ncbi:MAG: MFS transporter [Anaerolineales bacterium]|jgi:MFS family permease
MKKPLRWINHLTLNIYWFGINMASGSITPIILPFLVTAFVGPDLKNTYLGYVRAIGLVVAMLVQPVAGMLSDRSTSRFGRRRPYIFVGAILSVLFLFIIGISPSFDGSSTEAAAQSLFLTNPALMVLLIGIVLLQVSSNIAHGAVQGLIPDIVPEDQRGRSSGVKAVLELLPLFLMLGIGPLVDGGLLWVALAIIMGSLLITMLITLFCVREEPLTQKPATGIGDRVWRLVALTAIFVAVTQAAQFLVSRGGAFLDQLGASVPLQVAVVGLIGLAGMAGSIFLGVYFGAWVGIGKQAPKQTPFIWWVINRLLFLAAVGSIQGFAQNFLQDVIGMENAATANSMLMASVGVFVIVSALVGGNLADKVGRKRLIAYSGLLGVAGTLILLFSKNMLMAILSGSVIGLGAGTFMATNWALGTDLAPPKEAGRYLGISNLAGAGAGIVGAGIGGPMADTFNALRPGLGYLVIFGIYGGLFLISVASLAKIPETSDSTAAA